MADPDSQKFYRLMDIDPAKVECHFSPGHHYSMDYINLFGNIRDNAIRLHQMDLEGKSESDNYRRLESEIKWGSVELQAVEYRDDLENYMAEIGKAIPQTGVSGVNRDTIFSSAQLREGIASAVRDGGNPNPIPVFTLPIIIDNSGVEFFRERRGACPFTGYDVV